jgi:hypothetical protein
MNPKIENYSDYVNSRLLDDPKVKLTYSPVRSNNFEGQQLVERFSEASPLFYKQFNKVIPLEIQTRVMEQSYYVQGQIWLDSKPILKPGF